MRVPLLGVAALLLAGCLAPAAPLPVAPAAPLPVAPPGADAAPTLAPAAAAPLRLEDCSNAGGLFRVLASAAAPFVPEGFEAVPATTGFVQLYVIGLQCARAVLADGTEAAQPRAMYAELVVVPPPEYEREGAADYTIPVMFLASPEPVARALADLRYGGAAAADVAREETATPLATIVRFEGDGVELVATMVEPQTQHVEGGSVRQFGADHGALQSVLDVDFGASTCTAGAALALTAGDAPIGDALPAATGGRCAGYTLDFWLAQIVA
ncbi:MAG TPA: hypothetical protein VGR28_09565 [Candidatus Thermoplasmatota archaeon]|jgi:hypothetical protein|nr:hypothetical protein [Candidatus Thermoplasmatota archaeon]